MPHKRLVCAVLFVFSVAHLWGGSRTPRFLTFSAKDRNGIFLRDLKPGEVTLLVGDQPADVRYFGYRDVDSAFAFLIENSPRTAKYNVSMPQYGRINEVDQVRYYLSGGYLQSLLRGGTAMVAEFYQELNVLQDFTGDEYLLSNALDRMTPHASGLDREHIPIGRMLGRGVDLLRERPEKRKVLVLFTKTVDRESLRNLDEYRQMLRRFDVDLFVISFASRATGSVGRSHAEKANAFFFKRLTDETAGRFYLTGEYVYLREFMDDLLSRLQNSYTLGFYVDSGESRSEYDVEIRIDRPGCDVTARRKLVF